VEQPEIDGSQLENALLNLVINARDAMPDGGRITYRDREPSTSTPDGARRELTPGDYLCICVSDTGTG
jgi:signal transduction histidine kinase